MTPTSKFTAIFLILFGGLTLLKAQETVRSDFENAANGDAVFSGWEANLSAAAVVDFGLAGEGGLTINEWRISGGITKGGVNNAGDITGQSFIFAQVTSDFTIQPFRQEYLQHGDHGNFSFASNVMTFAKPDNPGYEIPYNTSNPLHLHELCWNSGEFHWAEGEQALMLILGVDGPGPVDTGEFNLSFATGNNFIDHFDFSSDQNGLQTNQQFGFPYDKYAVDALFTPKALLGDINLDGTVDLLDVAPFVELLTKGGFRAEADINQDGTVDLLDVAPFVDVLSDG